MKTRQPAQSGPLVCAELDYLWWGVCIGGKHYTGQIKLRDPYRTVEMVRTRSAKEAKEMAEREGRMWLARERETNKFDSLKQLERVAAKWCEANLGDNWVLLYDAHNPSIAIAGKGWVKGRLKTMTKLGKAWDKVPNHKRDFDHPAIRALCRAWGGLFSEANADGPKSGVTKRDLRSRRLASSPQPWGGASNTQRRPREGQPRRWPKD